METIEIYEKMPQGFSSQGEVVACYLEIEGKLLLLQRSGKGSEPHKWTVPAGKVERGESSKEAALRELFEETGISLSEPSQLEAMGSLFIRKPKNDYVYHFFKVQIDKIPSILLSPREHQSYQWVSLKDQEEIPFMLGGKEILKIYRQALTKKRRGASVNAYLILKERGKVLFLLRKNTGYLDGMWGLPSGHVEDGESATEGMVREAFEEVGIELSSSDLSVAHIMHRKTTRMNIDVFFTCSSWVGEVENREPKKCEKLEYFSTEALPRNVVDYVEEALKCISKGIFYSEIGWAERASSAAL